MSVFNKLFNSISNLYNSLFGSDSQQQGNVNHRRITPVKKDFTFPETVNPALTRGLWHNSIPGFKLGAQLCYNPIAVPLSFMGVPHFDLDDWDNINQKFWKEKLDFYNEKYINAKKNIQLMCHRDGTIIIWPWFDSAVNHVRWKFIKPEEVSQVTIDPDTNKLTGLVTSIRYCFYGINGKLYNYQEDRVYTKKIITIKRTGGVPPELNTLDIRKNPIGILPIVFGNNREPGDFEGYSDYERIIPLIKAYSEINTNAHQNEAKHGPKLVQKTSDVDEWKTTNEHLFDSNGSIDISSTDFILNIAEEDSKFEIPTGLNANAIILMENDFHNIVETSGIPEICWGLKTTGNHATAEEQMGILFAFVRSKEDQADPPYLRLQNATNKLEAMANMQQAPEGLKTIWNDLSTLTQLEKATIFKDYATGFEKLLANFAIDLQSVHAQLYELTNGMITSDYDVFEKQIREYGGLRAWAEQEYPTQRETAGDFNTQGNNKDNAAKGEKGRNGTKTA